VISVKDRAGAHHVIPSGRAADNRGAIGHVHDAGVELERFHAGERGLECFFLLDGLLGRENFRRCDVRERARQLKVRAIGQCAHKRRNFRRRDAQAIHPRIDLEMKAHRAAAFFARPRGGLLQQFELLGAHDCRRKIVFQDALFFSGPETRENQDRLANAAFAQFGAFGGASYAEPVGSCTR